MKSIQFWFLNIGLVQFSSLKYEISSILPLKIAKIVLCTHFMKQDSQTLGPILLAHILVNDPLHETGTQNTFSKNRKLNLPLIT